MLQREDLGPSPNVVTDNVRIRRTIFHFETILRFL